MTDLVAVAGNAVAAYQRALGTVSNNIANVATNGYSRQEITLEANPVSKVGNIYLGTGVIVAGVKRQYDAFTEANLRNSNSDLSSQEPMVNYANRVIDVMGGPTTGLTTAIDQFFNSARDLSSDPASTVLRGSFVRDAEGLASRFGELSSQLDMVQSETDQSLQSSVSQMNTIFGELANVNKQLTKVQTEAAQPPDLLDQRDTLLKDLSTYAHVNTKFTTNGTVTVSLGSSINQDVVVDGNNSKLISIYNNPDSPGKANLILDQYGAPSTLTGITSGKVAGLLAFQEQVLGTTRSALDNLATTLTGEINNVHEQGVDGYGKAGGALFTLDPSAASVAGGIKVAFNDPLKVSAAAQFRVIQNPSNTGGSAASVDYIDPSQSTASAGPMSLSDILVNNDHASAGRSITIDSSRPAMAVATVLNGMQDVSIFLDNPQAGQQLQVMTRDGRLILGGPLDASSLEATALLSTNGIASGAQLSDSYLNKTGDAGYKDMAVFYGLKADVRQEPIFDNSGQSLTSKALAATVTSGRIDTNSAGFAAGAFVLNGVSLGALSVAPNAKLQASDVAQWLRNANTGITVTASNEIRVTDQQLNLNANLAINDQDINGVPFSNKQALINAINGTPNVGVFASMGSDGAVMIRNSDGSNIKIATKAGGVDSPGNALGLPAGLIGGTVTMTKPLVAVTSVNAKQVNILASQLNLAKPLTLFGNAISKPSPGFGTAQNLADAINAAQTGVSATIDNGVLTLTNPNAPDGSGVFASIDSDGTLAISNSSSSATYIDSTITMSRPAATNSGAVTNTNTIRIPAAQVIANLNLPLAINGQTIFKPSTGFVSAANLAAAINKAQSTVNATVDADGNLTLISTNGPDNNSIQIATDSAGINATGNALGLQAQVFRSAITSTSSTQVTAANNSIELGFGTALVNDKLESLAKPTDLAALGFRTGAYIKGAAKEDLLVFVTGAGTASVAASYAGKPVDARQSLRTQPMELTFTSATHYRIRDINTDTIVAERNFNPDQTDLSVSFQGLKVSFTTPPQAGDVFKVDGNSDGTGNNENMLALAAVENKALVGSKTLSTAYIDHVNNIGNIARQATIAKAALTVVHDQAVTAKDQVSGVSLDQEAADLIRYQQAYQAAAKVLQVGSQLFDSILQVR
jgi:flagellar hook-associated protein FlgK